jgi:diacylglycerol kinase family enzyme
MARELGIPRNADRIKSLVTAEKLRSVWSIIKAGNVRKIDMLRINDDFYSLHLSDIGLNAKVVKRFEEEQKRGWLGYAHQFIKEFTQKKKLRYRIAVNGRRRSGKAYMIVLANARRYGTGAVINAKGQLDDGKFEICIIRDITLWSLLRTLLSVFKRSVEYHDNNVRVISCEKATILLNEKHTLQVDGEIVGEFEQIDVCIEPHCLQMIV